MDKSWIDMRDRTSTQYLTGVENFLDFAFSKNMDDTRIYCPCKKCHNRYLFTRDVVRGHIIWDGFMSKYKNWTQHGELQLSLYANQDTNVTFDSVVGDDMIGMIHDAFGHPNAYSIFGNDRPTENEHSEGLNDEGPNGEGPIGEGPNGEGPNGEGPNGEGPNGEGPNDETRRYLKLLQDAELPLYPGCENFTKLSFIVRLLHMKVVCGWTDKSVTLLLSFLKEAFPNGVELPDSYYEAQKITVELDFTYKTWDACPNNCMLFRDEDEKLEKCDICQESRYEQLEGEYGNIQNLDRKIPAKQARYFPLKRRLQRLFMSSKTASLMKWHTEERTNDGVLRHPADTAAWKTFDEKNPYFASDSRNVRLGLASDGFNPFRTMSINHSTWPVVLIPYNLPPWI
ncbi:uncharacterized protein LOC110767383, partial [Prunus avium]|uniref:Uncharacterized protein LOC110767383 n=1 Tax=Prunus avium TaxID=42229 RepID=A0A6P5TGU9_PRUAV